MKSLAALWPVAFVGFTLWAVLSVIVELAPGVLPPAHPVEIVETPDFDDGERLDCRQLLGTAFRTPGERQWFESNCSRWVPEATAEAGAYHDVAPDYEMIGAVAAATEPEAAAAGVPAPEAQQAEAQAAAAEAPAEQASEGPGVAAAEPAAEAAFQVVGIQVTVGVSRPLIMHAMEPKKAQGPKAKPPKANPDRGNGRR